MEQYSWNQLSENKIVKTLDYSAFRTGSGIPQAMMCQSWSKEMVTFMVISLLIVIEAMHLILHPTKSCIWQ